jgi:hypothetical protein
VTAVEALASGQRIQLAQVRLRDRLKDRADLILQLRPRRHDVTPGPLGEDDDATIRIGRAAAPLLAHSASRAAAAVATSNARVNRRPARSLGARAGTARWS